MSRSSLSLLVWMISAAALGALGAALLNATLGVRFADKDLPVDGRLPSVEPLPEAEASIPEPIEVPDLLPWRLVDSGAVGIDPDPTQWNGDYSHHSWAFRRVMLAQPPWIDEAAFAATRDQWRRYLRRMQQAGYNGVVFPAFLELLRFDRLEGEPIYPAGSEWLRRHAAVRFHFRQLFTDARALGMRVVLATDMVALTPPLERYLKRLPGGLDPRREAFWSVYRTGLEELFIEVPEVDGLLIRIGEAGGIYNIPGWEYRSELLVRDAEAVRTMLRGLLPVFEAHGRTLIFRSWSVGVGEVGDMHTNVATYDAVLGDLDSPNLIVSTKYVQGDFYSFLPFNPTLFAGPQRRIVELQARREFEGFGAFPNYLVPLHQAALRHFRNRGANLVGVWLWSQSGGPLRQGPMMLYPFHGGWQWVDANVRGTGRLFSELDADPRSLALEWARDTLGPDPEVAAALADVLLGSRLPVLEGLYVGPFAEKQVFALGLEPPPMMWIFEWDIVSGASSVLSVVHHLSRDQLDRALAEGHSAARRVAELQARLAAVADRVPEEKRETYLHLLDSLAYEQDLFETLAAYRDFFLNYYHWLGTGERNAADQARLALPRLEARKRLHLERYEGHLDFPAFSFFAVDAGLRHARRGRAVTLASRATSSIAILLVLASLPAVRSREGASLWRALGLGLASPWKLGAMSQPTAVTACGLAGVVLGLPILTLALFSSFASASLVLGMGGITAAGVLVPVAFAAVGGRSAAGRLLAGAAPLIVLSILMLVVLGVRGPLYFWTRFWLDGGFRTAWLVSMAVGFAWLLFAQCSAVRSVTGRGRAASAGCVAMGGASALGLLATTLGVPGLENALTRLNDEVAVLPLGLSRILGITTHLGIPLGLPLVLAEAAVALAVASALAIASERLRRPRA